MIVDIASALFRSLRFMDGEAATPAAWKDGQDYQTGLFWYEGYWNSEPTRGQVKGTEPAWTRRLAQVLPEREGIPCCEQVTYPGKAKQTCDLVIHTTGPKRLWIEVKGAFKSHWVKKGDLTIYRKHLLALDEPSWAKDGSAAKDVKKLQLLQPADAAYIGILLIDFDTESYSMDGEIEQLRELVGLRSPLWDETVDQWEDRYESGRRVRCWFWWQQTIL
jgi:hypothetical protein